MSFSITAVGLDKLQAFASNLAVNYKQDLTASVVSAFQECEQGIIKDCPVKTGRMKKSITLTVGNNNGPNGNNNNSSSQGEVIARIDIPVPYAGFVEWGHRTRMGSGKHHSKSKSHGYVKPRYFVTPNVNRMLSRLAKRR